MKEIGIVQFYNGKFGTILKGKETIDFSVEDVPFSQEICENSIVTFRIEERFPTIKLARNIIRVDHVRKEDTEKIV